MPTVIEGAAFVSGIVRRRQQECAPAVGGRRSLEPIDCPQGCDIRDHCRLRVGGVAKDHMLGGIQAFTEPACEIPEPDARPAADVHDTSHWGHSYSGERVSDHLDRKEVANRLWILDHYIAPSGEVIYQTRDQAPPVLSRTEREEDPSPGGRDACVGRET
jgi:hypothetical protein